MSKIAFLLLTYDEHNKYIELENFLKSGNIYVHAKYPKKVNSYLKNYIIKDYVETDWGGIGIVKAEIKLLENAIRNNDNKWFILLSQTCCPLLTYESLKNELNKNNNIYSFFDYVIKDGIFYKTSQFWILNRQDVETIINTQNKYLNLYKNVKTILDEKYFLTVLMNENKDYKFNNKTTTYSRWINVLGTLHPFEFNKITPYDIRLFNKNKYFFFRKITPSFSFKSYIPQKNLIILYIDNLKNNNIKLLNKISNSNIYNYDLIIFYTPFGNKYITPKLIEKSIYLFNVYYTSFDKHYETFLKDYNDLLSQWESIKLVKL